MMQSFRQHGVAAGGTIAPLMRTAAANARKLPRSKS
jgi:hypothetical protein